MILYRDAVQAKNSLKMTLSCYHWFRGIAVEPNQSEYALVVQVNGINDLIRKTVPFVHRGVSVRLVEEFPVQKVFNDEN